MIIGPFKCGQPFSSHPLEPTVVPHHWIFSEAPVYTTQKYITMAAIASPQSKPIAITKLYFLPIQKTCDEC